MKKILFILSICLIGSFSYGQTNTFPSSGNVGIGTLSPGGKLEVANSSGVADIHLTGSSWGQIFNTTGDFYIDNNANADMIFRTNGGNERLRILGSNGNVGIGTTTPQTKLHVYQSTADASGLIIQGNTINTDFAQHYIALTLDGDYGNGSGNYSQIRSYSNLYSAWGSQLAFFTSQSGVTNSLVERMRIDAAGKIGIGTTTPGAKLDIEGGTLRVGDGFGSFSGFSFNTNTGLTQENNNKVTLNGALQVNSTAGSDSYIIGTGNLGVGTTNTHGYKFAVNGSAIATSMTVQLYANWPDYVFKKDYRLPSLIDVKAYIDANQRLPEMPSEQEIAKNGLNLGEMNRLLVKKVEELTLYLVEKDNKDKEQSTQLISQQQQINRLQAQLQQLIKTSGK